MRLVTLILLTVCCVIFSLRLWEENVWVRLYNHQIVKSAYDPRKKPFVRVGEKMPVHIHDEARDIAGKCCILRTTALNDAYKAFNADHKGGALYWNHMKSLTENDSYLHSKM